MEDIVTKIEKKCHEKLMVYTDLLDIFRKEKKSIINGDITTLWQSSSEKQKKADDIVEIRNSVLEILDSAKIKHDLNQTNFSLVKIIGLFSGNDLKSLTKSLIAVNHIKKQIQMAGKANYNFIEEYLVGINELVDVFVGNTPKTALYNNKSGLSRNRGSGTVLLSREV